MDERKKKRFKVAVTGVILLGLAIFCLIYTRPQTIEARYPMLDMAQCTRVKGYYSDGQMAEQRSFVIDPDDPHFAEIIALFDAPAFRTRLKNLLPEGTRYHQVEDGDFEWELMFRFEDVQFPSGDVGSGDMLHIRNFFGDISLHFDGTVTHCSVKEQDQWLRIVNEWIMQYGENHQPAQTDTTK